MLAAPDGALNGALVAEGHLEHALDASERAEAYLDQPRVQQEIAEAAARSVLYPSYRPEHGWVWAHNIFAMVWYLSGRYSKALPHFEALGRRAWVVPWYVYGKPGAARMFARARRAALGSLP